MYAIRSYYAAAELVQGAGEELLAGAALAGDEDRLHALGDRLEVLAA